MRMVRQRAASHDTRSTSGVARAWDAGTDAARGHLRLRALPGRSGRAAGEHREQSGLRRGGRGDRGPRRSLEPRDRSRGDRDRASAAWRTTGPAAAGASARTTGRSPRSRAAARRRRHQPRRASAARSGAAPRSAGRVAPRRGHATVARRAPPRLGDRRPRHQPDRWSAVPPRLAPAGPRGLARALRRRPRALATTAARDRAGVTRTGGVRWWGRGRRRGSRGRGRGPRCRRTRPRR